MNLEKYQALTGNTIASTQEAKVKATIRKTQALLETLLGYSLTPKHLYTEKGKVQFSGYLPTGSELQDGLLPPDDANAEYKLFPFNDSDDYLHIDPFVNLLKVKLVVAVTDGEFVTVSDLDNVVPHYGKEQIGKYIERHYDWFTWQWYKTWRIAYASGVDAGLMLAVEADWMDCYPDDLMYLWCDMIDYYLDPSYSVMGNIQSESVDGHSWSRARGGAPVDFPPHMHPLNKQLLTRYTGPFGSIVRNPTR